VKGPLAGIRVVDWTIYGVGPFATSLLAAMGADVTKVEQAPRGDPQQFIGPFVAGLASLYINFNTGKRSIRLDLRDDHDREDMWKLIESADVLVTNFRAGTGEKLGFGPEEVLARNPGIVYVPTNGWGDGGPMWSQGAADTAVAVLSGWCSVTGREGGAWEQIRFAGHIDMTAAIYTTAAVLTGLIARERVGGQKIGLSMLEAALAMQSNRLSEYLAGGVTPVPLGSAYSVVAPSQAFECQDKAFIAVSAESESQWKRLCEALGREDLLGNPLFATNAQRVQHREELARELGEVFKTKPTTWWMLALNRAKVPNSKFWDWDDIRFHPQVQANEHLVEVDTGRCGVVHTGGVPWKFANAPAVIRRNPYSGEHADAIRAEMESGEIRPLNLDSPRIGGLPFAGLRVLELACGLAGPYCAAYLADQGAVVTKVEPADGDYLRGWGPPFVGGSGTAFAELNRNKVLRRINEFEGNGRQDLDDLLKHADVVIADAYDVDGNPPPITEAEARALNPNLIWCAISPYGVRGPLAGQPGSELTVQAMSNCWGGLGEIGQPPLRLGADQASMSTGIFAYQGVLAALWRRQHTGEGESIAVSILGSMLSIKGMHWTSLSNPDEWPGAHLRVWTDPPSNGFRAADVPVLFNLGRRGLGIDPTNIRALIERLGGSIPEGMDLDGPLGSAAAPIAVMWKPFWDALFSRHTSSELAQIFDEFDGDIIPFTDYPRLDAHPQVQYLQPFDVLGADSGPGDAHPIRVVRVPWRMDGYPEGFAYLTPLPINSTGQPLAAAAHD
jgi:CoA:oxalate CoA-transferase